MISEGDVALSKKTVATATAGATKAAHTKNLLNTIIGRAKNPLKEEKK
jgi:hypothetical protein